MGNCCDNRVLPAEYTPVTHTQPNKREHLGSLVKMEPEKHRHVSNILEKNHQKDTEELRIQAGTSIERPQCDIEVSPDPPDSTASPEYQRKPPIRMVKVKSRKCRYAFKIWRKFHWKCSIVPKNSEGLQVQADTSIARPQSEIQVSYAPSKSAAATVDQRNPAERAVKMISKKRRCVSTLLKIFSREQPVIPLGVDTPQVTAGPSRETAQIKTEVVHKNADIALSPMVKVGCGKCRCIPAILREIYEKQATANQDAGAHSAERGQMKVAVTAQLKRVHRDSMMASKERLEANVCNVTTAETADKKTEDLPDRADTTLTPDDPGTMVKVKCKKSNWISSLFKRFRKKTPVTSRDVEEPPAVQNTFVRTPEAQRIGLSNVPDIRQIFCREEEFDHYNEGAWEDYESYFPDGVPVKESRHTMVSTMVGSYIAQVGDTDVEDQQNLDSKESFPDAFEIQQWELRKESITDIPVLNVLFLAPPKSSDEDVVIIKKRRKKKRRRYY